MSDNEPTTSELRAPRPEDEHPVRHRRRRNTKQWCRGKPGVVHQLEIRLRRSVASRIMTHQHTGRGAYWPNGYACGWSWWMWRYYHDWYYRCGHERYCTACGKIFPLESIDCPDYATQPKPTISAQQAEADDRDRRARARAERAKGRAPRR